MSYEIEYANDVMRGLCEERRLATRKFGSPGAKRLSRRVKELETSPDTVTLRQGPGDWHPLPYDWPGCMAGELDGAASIIAMPITTKSGEPGWRVMCLGDCYKH